MKNEDWMARLLGRTLFPRAQDIPQPLASAFMRMMMVHANFESEVRALQGVVANSPYYGEQPENLWSAKKRPKLMAKLIEKCLGPDPGDRADKEAAGRRLRRVCTTSLCPRDVAIARKRRQHVLVASLPLQSSLMSKTYLKSDHFSGGGSHSGEVRIPPELRKATKIFIPP